MRRLLPLLMLLLATAPAAALELPADGTWFCGAADSDFGALQIEGESYRFTDLANFEHEGELNSEDGQLYLVESGILRDVLHVSGFRYDGADAIRLVIVYNDGSTGFGDCRRS